LPTSITLASVSTLPAGLLVSSNLAAGTATVTVNAGGQTIATFLNTNTTAVEMGLLKVCKIAGAGIAPGENFTFMRAGASFTVPAGFCVKQGMLPVGTVVTVTEMFSSGTVASAISVLPADRQGVVDLPRQAVSATIGAGVTEVYFTNVRTQ